jgi:hypothetical protein
MGWREWGMTRGRRRRRGEGGWNRSFGERRRWSKMCRREWVREEEK